MFVKIFLSFWPTVGLFAAAQEAAALLAHNDEQRTIATIRAIIDDARPIAAAFDQRGPGGAAAAAAAFQNRRGVFGDLIDPDQWEENNPFSLATKNAAALRKLHIYFDCGDRDDFGFDRGATALDRLLTKKKVSHEFHLYPGDHSLTYFLSHIAEIMEFHSRAFEAAK